MLNNLSWTKIVDFRIGIIENLNEIKKQKVRKNKFFHKNNLLDWFNSIILNLVCFCLPKQKFTIEIMIKDYLYLYNLTLK